LAIVNRAQGSARLEKFVRGFCITSNAIVLPKIRFKTVKTILLLYNSRQRF
jgi:hypothetical protein